MKNKDIIRVLEGWQQKNDADLVSGDMDEKTIETGLRLSHLMVESLKEEFELEFAKSTKTEGGKDV
jgi:hypothetical protein